MAQHLNESRDGMRECALWSKSWQPVTGMSTRGEGDNEGRWPQRRGIRSFHTCTADWTQPHQGQCFLWWVTTSIPPHLLTHWFSSAVQRSVFHEHRWIRWASAAKSLSKYLVRQKLTNTSNVQITMFYVCPAVCRHSCERHAAETLQPIWILAVCKGLRVFVPLVRMQMKWSRTHW